MCVYISCIVYVYIYIACIVCGVYTVFQYIRIYIFIHTLPFSVRRERSQTKLQIHLKGGEKVLT